MRVIAGSAKGTRLRSPRDRGARPTLDRVREALFSILGARVEDARVLDLFAGTGAIGIEALSRGAARCEFVEKDRERKALILENLNAAKVRDRASVRASVLPEGLSTLARDGSRFDIIYADPPFDFGRYAVLCAEIDRLNLLNPEGILIVEHDSKTALGDRTDRLIRVREARYGRTTLSFFASEMRQAESDIGK